MYVNESEDCAEIAMRESEEYLEQASAEIEEDYRQHWFDAVTKEPLDSFVIFDQRPDWAATKDYNNRVMRESTVLELFSDLAMDGGFDARIAKIVIDAHRAGSVEATSLLEDMAAAFAGQKV